MSYVYVLLRLLAAFLCGWLIAFLNVLGYAVVALNSIGNIDAGFAIPLLALLLPLGLGVVVAMVSAYRRNKHVIPLALLTGMVVVAGWYVYWLPQMIREDAASTCVNCPLHGPYGNNSSLNTSFLIYFWAISTVLVLVSSLITALIIKHRRKRSHS